MEVKLLMVHYRYIIGYSSQKNKNRESHSGDEHPCSRQQLKAVRCHLRNQAAGLRRREIIIEMTIYGPSFIM